MRGHEAQWRSIFPRFFIFITYFFLIYGGLRVVVLLWMGSSCVFGVRLFSWRVWGLWCVAFWVFWGWGSLYTHKRITLGIKLVQKGAINNLGFEYEICGRATFIISGTNPNLTNLVSMIQWHVLMVAQGQCDSESRENKMGISWDQINIYYGRIVSEASFCLTDNITYCLDKGNALMEAFYFWFYRSKGFIPTMKN